MGREILVQDAVVERFEQFGWLCRPCVYAGRKGSPDRWFLRKGMWLLVEFKRRDRPVDPIQKREHDRLKMAGARVYVIDNIEDGFDLVETMTRLSDTNVHR